MATPATPRTAKLQPSSFLARLVNIQKPTLRPTKANATQGNRGKSHGCGRLKMCTPLIYDSSGHGRNFGRQMVHKPGVANATAAAAAIPAARLRLRATAGEPE